MIRSARSRSSGTSPGDEMKIRSFFGISQKLERQTRAEILSFLGDPTSAPSRDGGPATKTFGNRSK